MMRTNPWRGVNKTDFHLCGTCGTHLFLTGKSRNRRFFFLLVPVFFAVMVLTSIAFGLLGWVITEGPNKGEPTFGTGVLMVIMIFIALSAINGRQEEVESVKLEGGPTQ